MLHSINCTDCGDVRKTRFSNTKRCVRCKVLADLLFVRERTYSCTAKGCDQRYMPLILRDPYCPTHAIGAGRFVDKCPFCKQPSELHRVDFPVCMTCLRDPAQRQRIVESLQRGQRERRKSNGLSPIPRRTLEEAT